jgi:hypothetical protein
MANSIPAEPMAPQQRNPADVDKPLTQETKSSEGGSQPHLRIVHSADRSQAPSASTPQPRRRQASDRAPAMLDRTVQAQIGRLLRDVFADVADEPVPDRFITLLAQLEAKEKPR